MELTIRNATVADLEAMADLWQEYMDFHAQRDAHFARAADGRARFKEFIAGHIAAGKSCVLVAERDGGAIGYCLATLAQYPPVFQERDYGTIFDLAVTARCRRQGVGEKLYRAVQDWFAERGIHRIELRAAVTNETSTAFWRKMGFAPFVEVLRKHV